MAIGRSRKVSEDKDARDNLMLAACRVIGRRGYKAASVARIAEEAGISAGHCYKFFPSRDAILENVILWILERFEEFSDKKLSKAQTYIDFETDALNRYFEFQKKNPFFITILRDSEVETPGTWQKFSDSRFERYVEALGEAFERGEIRGFTRDQLQYVSRMLSSMRRTIVFNHSDESAERDAAIAAYLLFVQQGLGLGA